MEPKEGRKPGGRPRADDPLLSVSACVPPSTLDRVIQEANRREVSVSRYIREVIEESLAS